MLQRQEVTADWVHTPLFSCNESTVVELQTLKRRCLTWSTYTDWYCSGVQSLSQWLPDTVGPLGIHAGRRRECGYALLVIDPQVCVWLPHVCVTSLLVYRWLYTIRAAATVAAGSPTIIASKYCSGTRLSRCRGVPWKRLTATSGRVSLRKRPIWRTMHVRYNMHVI